MDRDKLSNWHVTTDKFEITYPHEEYDDSLPFRVATICSYPGQGRAYQPIYLSEELITLSEEEIINLLSKWMQDGIDYLTEMGDIKKQDRKGKG
jgi:hypothetical protein